MGFGDNAIHVLNSNRRLLKKTRTFTELKESYLGYAKEEQLEFKQLTEFEQKSIRDKIQAQAKRDQHYIVEMRILAFLILIIAFFILYLIFS